VGLALSVAAIFSPRYVLPVVGGISALLLACVFILHSLGQRESASDSASFSKPESEPTPSNGGVAKFVALAVVVRIAVVLVVNYSDLWRSFAPDAHAWEAWGKALSNNWGAFFGGTYEGRVNPHVIANAGFATVFGDSRVPTSVFNTIFGISLAFVVRALAREIYGERVGQRAFVFMLFFPSLVLWQSQNLKDVWSEVATAGLALAVVRFGQVGRSRIWALVLGGLCLAFATWTRPYLSVILTAAVLISLASAKASRLPSAMFVGLLAVFGGKLAGLDEVFSEETLVTIDQARKGLSYGGSAYGSDVDTTTLTGALTYFPEGLVRFLFAPFPWEIDSALQVMALPESLFFLFLSIQAARQVLAEGSVRRVLVLLAFFFCIAGSYALASGNEGTAFRHRAQVFAFVVVLASAHQIRRRSPAEVNGVASEPGDGSGPSTPERRPSPVGARATS
jgi:hypothetical protein